MTLISLLLDTESAAALNAFLRERNLPAREQYASMLFTAPIRYAAEPARILTRALPVTLNPSSYKIILHDRTLALSYRKLQLSQLQRDLHTAYQRQCKWPAIADEMHDLLIPLLQPYEGTTDIGRFSKPLRFAGYIWTP